MITGLIIDGESQGKQIISDKYLYHYLKKSTTDFEEVLTNNYSPKDLENRIIIYYKFEMTIDGEDIYFWSTNENCGFRYVMDQLINKFIIIEDLLNYIENEK